MCFLFDTSITSNIFNVGSVIKRKTNGLTQSCKIVLARHSKIYVEYVNFPNKPSFLLDESNLNFLMPKYMLRSGSQVLPMKIQQSNTMEIHNECL